MRNIRNVLGLSLAECLSLRQASASREAPFTTVRAETVLERAERIEVSADAFGRFARALDKPDENMPVLRRYATKKSPIPAR